MVKLHCLGAGALDGSIRFAASAALLECLQLVFWLSDESCILVRKQCEHVDKRVTAFRLDMVGLW